MATDALLPAHRPRDNRLHEEIIPHCSTIEGQEKWVAAHPDQGPPILCRKAGCALPHGDGEGGAEEARTEEGPPQTMLSSAREGIWRCGVFGCQQEGHPTVLSL